MDDLKNSEQRASGMGQSFPLFINHHLLLYYDLNLQHGTSNGIHLCYALVILLLFQLPLAVKALQSQISKTCLACDLRLDRRLDQLIFYFYLLGCPL